MPHLNTMSRRPAAALLTLLAAGAVGSVGLAACGSSSTTTTTTAANAAAPGAVGTTTPGTTTPGAPGTPPPGARGSRFAAMRECLQKDGITLPQRRPGAGGFLGGAQGGPQLPAGVTRTQFEEALRKCGGGAFRGGNHFFRDSPRFRQAYAQFAACMRQNGVDLPTPNTSGKGPIFDTEGIDTTSAQFKAADAKCRSDLFAAATRGGGGAYRPPAGSPPAGSEGAAG
jgi:hypothetical protein